MKKQDFYFFAPQYAVIKWLLILVTVVTLIYMKIIKKSDEDKLQAITFRLPESLLEKLAVLADKNDISRQKLVAAILQKAIEDKSFRLEIKN